MVPNFLTTDNPRLDQQLLFLLEIDQLKHVLGRTLLPGGRRENAAEQSWHVAILASLLAEHANEKVDVCRVLQLVLVQNMVRIGSEEPVACDETSLRQMAIRWRRAEEQIFGLLPTDQSRGIHELWQEFQEQATPEARFAQALGKFQAVLLNYFSRGEMWRQYGLTASRLLAANASMATGSVQLWRYTEVVIQEAVRQGYLLA